MSKNRHKPEQIIAKLREVEVELSKGPPPASSRRRRKNGYSLADLVEDKDRGA